MTPIATALLVFVAFLVGATVGYFDGAAKAYRESLPKAKRRRITHEAPRTVQLSLVQWQRGLVREVGNRKR